MKLIGFIPNFKVLYHFYMEKYKLVLRVILPSMLCAILIHITNISLEYSTLSFGLIIGLINWGGHKYKPLLGVLLSVLASFVSFIIAYLSFAVTGAIFSFMDGDSGSVFGLAISTSIIAPLLLFFSCTFVFKIPKTRLTKLVIIFSLIILVSQSYLHYYIDSLSIDFPNYKILKPYTIWQMVMALALQLLLNQIEVNKLRAKIK
ncbi:hypothetical protein [Flaviramulus aquimarinus]|uniref:hypothetical protein n=1 Tax=Flaviramulus aquimarinus TaxID=1170456 RepID=UPI0031ED4152